VLPAGLAAQGLYIVSGNGQIVLEQFRSNVPVVVQARNQSGAPMAGVAGSWSLTGNVASLSEHDNVTDSNGLASAVYVASSPGFGYSMAPGTITASASVGSATFQY